MKNKHKLLLDQLDKKLEPFTTLNKVVIPDKGWINTIRTSLNMTMEQLGNKLNISRQGVKYIEESEVKGSLNIKALKEFGQALDLKLIYGFIPKDGTIDKLVDKKALEMSQRIVLRTNQNMKLEDQGIEDEKIKQSIQELAAEIKREMRRSLWD